MVRATFGVTDTWVVDDGLRFAFRMDDVPTRDRIHLNVFTSAVGVEIPDYLFETLFTASQGGLWRLNAALEDILRLRTGSNAVIRVVVHKQRTALVYCQMCNEVLQTYDKPEVIRIDVSDHYNKRHLVEVLQYFHDNLYRLGPDGFYWVSQWISE